jgi:OCT family organic cation transporter-like MFS transporter 4/5
MPESARWLILKGRKEEARQWLGRIAKYNRREAPSIAMIEEIAKTEKAQQSIAEKYSYLDLFRTRRYAIRTCVLMLGW